MENIVSKLDNQKVCDSSEKLYSLSDENLYQLCKNFGARVLEWRRKFAGLLPEVYRRRLYEKKGFESIFVFAKKLAGMSEEQVRLILNLEKRFEKLSVLKNLLVNGEVSVNKLARVASIADAENQSFLAENLTVLSQAAVETLVRDEKWMRQNEMDLKNKFVTGNLSLIGQKKSADFENQNGLFEPQSDDKSLRAQTCQFNAKTLNLSAEVYNQLLKLQNKGFDINQLILEFLKRREEKIAQRKEDISRKVLQREEKRAEFEKIDQYILEKPVFLKARSQLPVIVKKILKEEYGTKCAVPNCQKQAEDTHHTLPYAIGRSHDPHFLVPLCKEHHELEHAVNAGYVGMKIGLRNWI